MNSLQGSFLVASPQLPDLNFFHSVILLIQHDENGAFGVVLNRPTGRTVGQAWEVLSPEPCESHEPIYRGGPVQGSLLALHCEKELSEREILPGIYMAAQKDLLFELVGKSPAAFRILSGYAGWGAGQLENEISSGGWLTTEATEGEIFGDPDNQWERMSRQIGKEMLSSAVPPDKVPDDPSLN